MSRVRASHLTDRRLAGLKRLHRVNAVLLAAFLALHLVTHLSGAFGVDTYNEVQGAFRRLYRQPVVETLLLASISTQLAIGAALLWNTLKTGRVRGFWASTQILSGGLFFVFMAQHLFSLGMARLYFHLDTNFYWPASVMSGPPFVYYFIPYYFLGVLSVIVHIGVAIRYRLFDAGRTLLGDIVGVSSIAGGAVISASVLPIIAGAYFEIDLPQEWIDYLRFYVPAFEPRSSAP